MRISRRDTLAGMGMTVLAGCGGGSGPSPSPTPSPSPSPSPSPTPTASQAELQTFGTLGLTSSQSYAVLAYSVRAREGGWDLDYDYDTLDLNPGAAVRFAAPDSLLLTVRDYGEDIMVPTSGSYSQPGSQLSKVDYDALGGHATNYWMYNGENDLKYSRDLYWVSAAETALSYPMLLVECVYGVPTPSTGIPGTGQARYRASYDTRVFVDVDFQTRTMTGTLNIYDSPTPVATLRDVELSANGTTFSGRLIRDDSSPEGVLVGQFTGPNAQEFLARYAFPNNSPETREIFKVFGGVNVS